MNKKLLESIKPEIIDLQKQIEPSSKVDIPVLQTEDVSVERHMQLAKSVD